MTQSSYEENLFHHDSSQWEKKIANIQPQRFAGSKWIRPQTSESEPRVDPSGTGSLTPDLLGPFSYLNHPATLRSKIVNMHQDLWLTFHRQQAGPALSWIEQCSPTLHKFKTVILLIYFPPNSNSHLCFAPFSRAATELPHQGFLMW